MAVQRYRLQALLIIKEQEKKRTELVLATAIKELAEARERAKELVREKEEIVKKWHAARDEMSKEMTAGSSIFDGNVHTNFLRKLKEDEEEKEKEIEEQKEVIKEAEEAAAEARKEYIEASKELKVMEKHKELWRKKVEKELSRKEERELNDLGNTIHQLRRWKGEEVGI